MMFVSITASSLASSVAKSLSVGIYSYSWGLYGSKGLVCVRKKKVYYVG